MGNSHSQSSRFTPSVLNGSNKEPKEGRKSKFASPENRVLPVTSHVVPQRLRSTDNGNILQNGGTISGRKAHFIPVSDPEPEFVQLLHSKKNHHASPVPSESISFQMLHGHRKSHSDPDIVRMMMAENGNDSDEDYSDNEERCETDGNFSQRSIIAVSPSKAKIKSRKKKRAPEPPQSNTLPRTLNRLPQYKDERPGSSHSTYEYTETPRRPLPPIPPEEMPPPPPPPPPDYNRGSDDFPLKGVSKNYEKNRRTVDKWKFSKQTPQDLPVERVPRQRCKSLDRCEEQRLMECAENRKERCHRNNSLRRANHAPSSSGYHKGGDDKTPEAILRDAIEEATKKRSERLERGQEYRNSSFKLSMKHPKDVSVYKNQAQNDSFPTESSQSSSYKNSIALNHKNVSDHHSSRYDKYAKSSEKTMADHTNSHNFIRKSPVHKKGSDNRKENRNYFPTRSHERQPQMEYKRYTEGQTEPIKCNGRKSKWDSIIRDPIPAIHASTAISISSTSTEEMEIDLQLRPTLPRRPVELSRFSPTDVWKSINLDFFKSHQQRSDVSSDDAEDIMEEKICHINRPVAPRRLIHDRSGDSGISPDAGSPLLLNESLDVLLMNNNTMCNMPSEPLLAEDTNNMWVPQHDLADDSECGTDESPLENNRNSSSKINVQAKLSMPNLMFPSRSLPRTDQKNGIDEVVISDREKIRSKGRRKKSYKNAEGQHFNSLRNLKKALGLRLKTPVDESKGLDPNWSLSRSLPNFINNLNVEVPIEKPDDEDPEIYVLDHIRRSNSESKAMYQEKLGAKLTAGHSQHNLNSEIRNSFSCQTSEGHVIYLPEYRSSTTQLKSRPALDEMHVNTDSELILKKSNSNIRKKFTYQSTVRQEEKKKLEEKLVREAEARERKRQQEIEWMNKVEEEFRKQRDKEKVNIRHQLRILNLQEKSEANDASKSESNDANHQVPKNEIAEFAENFSNIKPNVQYGFSEMSEKKMASFKSSKDVSDDPCKWQQPTGMKKWLKRQNRDYQCPMRPEPEGGRSSSDDCKQVDRNGTTSNGYYKSNRSVHLIIDKI